MEAIKNINNNVCLCIDSQGREIIAFGKGIGSVKAPHSVPLSKIERTFYNVRKDDYFALEDIPIEVIKVALHIIDLAEIRLQIKYPPSAVFAMADHINFSVTRENEHIYLDMPIVQDLKLLYPEEMKLAYEAVEYINEKLGLHLMRNEAGTLALHLVNDRQRDTEASLQSSQEELESCTRIIEQVTGKQIDRSSYNYSRFSTHFDYMLKRLSKEHSQISEENRDMYQLLKTKYPRADQAVELISEHMKSDRNIELTEEEKLYLLIYVNRLCNRQME